MSNIYPKGVINKMLEILKNCEICPYKCKVNRLEGKKR